MNSAGACVLGPCPSSSSRVTTQRSRARWCCSGWRGNWQLQAQNAGQEGSNNGKSVSFHPSIPPDTYPKGMAFQLHGSEPISTMVAEPGEVPADGNSSSRTSSPLLLGLQDLPLPRRLPTLAARHSPSCVCRRQSHI
ncbi:hypothetical protein MVEN_01173200 [Mycena venus]|uniref:Uncharacterized protein n=1 Tax=Mycena venus TaxID=2733690 RepID=A0A8H6Y2H6_9AGAR|nr:hypothetical protein MVEN_01173200 [Mycena venus]